MKVPAFTIFVSALLSTGGYANPNLSLSDNQGVIVESQQQDTGDYANTEEIYIVELADPAVASYTGTISGYEATNPALTGATHLDVNDENSQKYANFLEGKQNSFIEHCDNAFGRKITVSHKYQHVLNAVAISLTAEEAKAITLLPNVKRVEKERFAQPMTDAGPKWIGVESVWNADASAWPPEVPTKGEGVVVAILDTGINSKHPSFADVGDDGYDHVNPLGSGNYIPGSYCDTVDPDFCNDKVIGAWGFARGFSDPNSPEDNNGHGSHVAGTVAGNFMNNVDTAWGTTSISGVAPHANIVVYDVCESNFCSYSSLIAGVEQVVVDASVLPNGIQALNYSITGGFFPYRDSVELGFLNATAAGIFVSAAAGNDGPGASTSHHNGPWLASVAAMTHNRQLEYSPRRFDYSDDYGDILASFSSKGPYLEGGLLKPDIAAPGVRVLAAVHNYGGSSTPFYGFKSGTSMATPHNTGAAALLSVIHPDWTPYEIKSALMMSAKTTNLQKEYSRGPADAFDVGAGRLDISDIYKVNLVLDETPENFLAANPATGGDLSTLNLASMQNLSCEENCSWTRRVKNGGSYTSIYRLGFEPVQGLKMRVSPSLLRLAPGEEADIEITANATFAEVDWNFTELSIVPFDRIGSPALHMPIALKPVRSTNAALLEVTSPQVSAEKNDIIDYQIKINNGPIDGPMELEVKLPKKLSLVSGSLQQRVFQGKSLEAARLEGNTILWRGELESGSLKLIESSSPFGYVPLAEYVSPIDLRESQRDDSEVDLLVPEFTFNGETYNRVSMSTNGALVVGDDVHIPFSSVELPNTNQPNNMLAPFWRDLDLRRQGDLYFAVITDGDDEYSVFEWNDVYRFNGFGSSYTFQVWIQSGDSGNVWFVYEDLDLVDEQVSIGVEGPEGLVGYSYLFGGYGTIPSPGVDLKVIGGGVATFDFQAKLKSCPKRQAGVAVRATLDASTQSETSFAPVSCQ